jgi:hypothetical protein
MSKKPKEVSVGEHRFLQVDHEAHDVRAWFREQTKGARTVVYCAPPSSASTAGWWRGKAQEDREKADFALLSERVYGCMAAALPTDAAVKSPGIFVEGVGKGLAEEIEKHGKAVGLPKITARYEVRYKAPTGLGTGEASVKTNGVLVQFGGDAIKIPVGLGGVELVTRIAQQTRAEVIVDPCIGCGAAARAAFLLDIRCVGAELNEERLRVTTEWLKARQ